MSRSRETGRRVFVSKSVMDKVTGEQESRPTSQNCYRKVSSHVDIPSPTRITNDGIPEWWKLYLMHAYM